jgi:hypothetical protein
MQAFRRVSWTVQDALVSRNHIQTIKNISHLRSQAQNMRNLRLRKPKHATETSTDLIVLDTVPEEIGASNFYSAAEDETSLEKKHVCSEISTAALAALSSPPIGVQAEAQNISLNPKPPKKCLFIGLVWQVQETVTEQELCTLAYKTSHQNMCPLQDTARILKTRQFGFDVFSFDQKDLMSPKHFCMNLDAYE